MILNNKNIEKNPTKKEIKYILELINSNNFENAKKEIRRQMKKHQNSSILFNLIGAVLVNQNSLNEGLENYKKSIEINPNYAQAYNNLGVVLQKLNKKNEAIDKYRKAINLKVDFAEAYNNLGCAIQDKKKAKEAIYYLEKALHYKPNYAEAYNNIGRLYDSLGRKSESIDNFKKAININPQLAEAHLNLGLVFHDISRFFKAQESYEESISLKKNNEKAYNNLGNLMSDLGKIDEAEKFYNEVIKINSKNALAHSNILFNYNYKINWDHKSYLVKASKFRLNCKSIKKNFSFKYKHEKNPTKIKIGFISADFGNHPGGYFTLSTLKELKKKNFTLIAYSSFDREDEISYDFRSLFSKWSSIAKKKDEEIIEEIFGDGLNILVDLQGHSAKNRLPIFIYKPAPIQITWLSQGSLGIPEIDYFIGSPHITPKEEENHYIERVLRLPEISQCFTPPNFDIKIKNLPAIENKFITFGCINKFAKINDEVLKLWSKIILSLPNSKIILKCKEFDNQEIVIQTLQKFKMLNINKDRIILMGSTKTRKKNLEVYNKIDIALDPFPFQGNTSTCEAVWMGVPVLTLKGNRYLFHFGESINSNLNMRDWIAKDKDEYIFKAVKFASNLSLLSDLRKNLREKALQSPVFDAVRFSEHFSNMLWEIWLKFKNKK